MNKIIKSIKNFIDKYWILLLIIGITLIIVGLWL